MNKNSCDLLASEPLFLTDTLVLSQFWTEFRYVFESSARQGRSRSISKEKL
jgi:hypothetical protein